jgi:hypothetical protein
MASESKLISFLEQLGKNSRINKRQRFHAADGNQLYNSIFGTVEVPHEQREFAVASCLYPSGKLTLAFQIRQRRRPAALKRLLTPLPDRIGQPRFKPTANRGSARTRRQSSWFALTSWSFGLSPDEEQGKSWGGADKSLFAPVDEVVGKSIERRREMPACDTEYEAWQDACGDGRDAPECDELLERLQACLRDERDRASARQAHGAAWDERLMQLQKEIQAAWERLFHGLKLPPRPSCGRSSVEARSKILGNKKNAMIFSKKMDGAFRESGVQLADDETYACFVCVVKKPEYASEALTLNPLHQEMGGQLRINYVLEPPIMESVMNAIERDRIDYKRKK